MYTTHKHSHLLLNWSEQFFHNKAMSFSNGNSEQSSDQYQFPAAAGTAAVTVAATQSSTTEVRRFCRLPVEDVVGYFHTRYHRIFPRAYAFLILPVPQMMMRMTRRRRRKKKGRKGAAPRWSSRESFGFCPWWRHFAQSDNEKRLTQHFTQCSELSGSQWHVNKKKMWKNGT